jgi:hypothetical protein
MAHWKATIHLYLHTKSQVYQKIIAFAIAYLNQQKPISSSLGVKELRTTNKLFVVINLHLKLELLEIESRQYKIIIGLSQYTI